MSIFYPSSIDFIKSRAKQLHRAFPDLPLSTCQQATAKALGFKDWFDASKRIGSANVKHSHPDEDVSRAERLQRRYQQTRALEDETGLPPLELDHLVRVWNLTASASPSLSGYITPYDEVKAHLDAFERGEMTEEQLEDLYDYEIPQRVADGIILARAGRKYTYYHLSTRRHLDMPIYLRGVGGILLDFEEGLYVKLAFPDLFPKREVQEALAYLEQNDPWRYEWHTGSPARDFYGVTLAEMLEIARKSPGDWIALSVRWPNDRVDGDKVITALRGADFIRFIEAKGSLKGLDLQWFKPRHDRVLSRLMHMNFEKDLFKAEKDGIRLLADEIVPADPLYGSPFKHAPMGNIEYDGMTEGGGIMLSVELEGGNDDDGDIPVIDLGTIPA